MARAVVDLIVTDLDGTLWGASCQPRNDVRAAFIRLCEVRNVLVATGRRPSSAFTILAANEMRAPAVLLDGALGCFSLGGERFHEARFSDRHASYIFDVFQAMGMEPVVNLDHKRSFGLTRNPSTHKEHIRDNARQVWQLPSPIEWSSLRVFGFAVCGTPHRSVADAIRTNLRGAADVSVTPDVRFGGWSISVRPPGVNKLMGVRAFCANRGLDVETMVAVGDGVNDLDLLSAAALALVPETACSEALDLADVVIPSPDKSGWLQLLRVLEC